MILNSKKIGEVHGWPRIEIPTRERESSQRTEFLVDKYKFLRFIFLPKR